MQKYKLWIILALIIVGIGALLFWLAPSQSIAEKIRTVRTSDPQANSLTATTPANLVQGGAFMSKSQQDTEVNCQLRLDGAHRLIVNEQTRNCFE